MKRWAVITVVLYAVLLIGLTAAAGFVLPVRDNVDVGEIFQEWGYWIWLGVLVVAQALLLLVPVDLSRRRLPARRKLFVPVVVGSFLLANLLFAGVFAIAAAFAGDDASVLIEAPSSLAERTLLSFPVTATALGAIGVGAGSSVFPVGIALGVLAGFWLFWAFLFYHFAKGDAADGLMRRATRWLLRASVLELLVAIPSHIIVRQRHDCCAPIASFWGIVTGISVMLVAFGPGVFFLFAKRIRHAQGARDGGSPG